MRDPSEIGDWAADERRSTSRLNQIRRAYVSRRLYLHENAWGLTIGVLCVASSIAFFAAPDVQLGSAAVGKQLGTFGAVWNGLYGVAGALVVFGIWKPHKGIDALGLMLLASALIINFAAIIITYGSRGVSVAAPLLGLAVGAVFRVRILTGRVR